MIRSLFLNFKDVEWINSIWIIINLWLIWIQKIFGIADIDEKQVVNVAKRGLEFCHDINTAKSGQTLDESYFVG